MARTPSFYLHTLRLCSTHRRLPSSLLLAVTSTIPLTLVDPLPDKVLWYLRIQRLTDEELAVAARPVSTRNKGEVLSALIEAFASLLEGFPISAEELGRRIDQGEYERVGSGCGQYRRRASAGGSVKADKRVTGARGMR
ncbi:hypothetical protein BC937DRAFT_86942 [Endogone sp. FLAS-F59071]|nr:hypothetical protein BC937DRAFT_86942 [Endogone sp. FLAS-F59071]|eukprot:RUS19773.1 hypothetical protein BC937DRAFT_86942 [Endogone sp. FLAS-F59071]